jgi:hypothetical protein
MLRRDGGAVADFLPSPTRAIDLLGSERRQDAAEGPRPAAVKRPVHKKGSIEAELDLEEDPHSLDERA